MKKTIKKLVSLVLLGTLALALLGCGSNTSGEYWPTRAWRTSSPEKQGLDPGVLNKINDYVSGSLPDTSSVLVVRHGFIVFERYYDNDKDAKRQVSSVTMSVISALIGIAVDQGLVKSIDDPISGYLPESIRGGMNEAAKGITVRHLLTMTAGFPGASGWGGVDPRILRSILSVKPVARPGAVFAYSETAANLLSVIITQASGLRASKFAGRNLLEPLGIKEARWSEPLEYTEGSDGLALSARDMAKLGQLFLTHGKWEKRQLISEEWIRASTRKQVDVPNFTLADSPVGYGFLWWATRLADQAVYFAMGYHGQYICVIPDQGTVVVMTGTGGNTEVTDRLPIVRDFVIKAAGR